LKCQNINMRLAIILTREELTHWKSYLILNTLILGKVWVGATFSQTQNEFIWDEDGIPVPSTFLASDGNPDYSGIPDGACLRFNRLTVLEWEFCNNTYTGRFTDFRPSLVTRIPNGKLLAVSHNAYP
ncbi:hypothetical protein ElyMa_004917100, partial [Elysia marginata]